MIPTLIFSKILWFYIWTRKISSHDYCNILYRPSSLQKFLPRSTKHVLISTIKPSVCIYFYTHPKSFDLSFQTISSVSIGFKIVIIVYYLFPQPFHSRTCPVCVRVLSSSDTHLVSLLLFPRHRELHSSRTVSPVTSRLKVYLPVLFTL